ncbi:hypothetical protein SCUCBS95973_000133 [Sporothrix curviconia]|uniref:Glycosyl hydrolase n=1 Tax=Sporothrix curviconia TaxID=1260050 RepID=A0ABP0AL32_9PEZI
MITRLSQLACTVLAASTVAVATAISPNTDTEAASPPRNSFLPAGVPVPRSTGNAEHGSPSASALAKFNLLDEFLNALRVMQDDYFEPWLGQWPKAIDWTAAVISTHVAGALSSLSQGLSAEEGVKEKENLITVYFSQLLSYYFGQDAFAIRNEAYDDMLWVVLGWLEAVQFIDFHTTLYHQSTAEDDSIVNQARPGLHNQSWYGNLWTPAFSHRARIFWDIASQGWDNKLCGGGMTWNPRLEPYKNAITNELFIAASTSMYLYFPGDANNSPFFNTHDPQASDPLASRANSTGSGDPHNPQHLQAALAGYFWLQHSDMKNKQGLFVDGFHISGWKNVSNPNTRCDQRNDMVYTYNQGVLLTGQIGLWKVTGDQRFLGEGHELIQSVINATGYDLARERPIDSIADLKPGQLPPWRGLGRAGVLEEQCDVGGQCSQNSQTFKGIFFHHLTSFCAPLDMAYFHTQPTESEAGYLAREIYERTARDHRVACSSYIGWIRHNVDAALSTKDTDGKFGMWWTAGLLQINATSLDAATISNAVNVASGGVDYRTYGVPNTSPWVSSPILSKPPTSPIHDQPLYEGGSQAPLMDRRTKHAPADEINETYDDDDGSDNGNVNAGAPLTEVEHDPTDPNNRGRGRTVETQGGGLAVLRCLWEITQRSAGI